MSEQEGKNQATTPTPPAPAAADQVRVASEHHELQKVIEYLETNGKTLMIVTAVAAVTVFGVLFFKKHRETSRAEAAAMLFKVESVQDLDNMVSRYGSTPVGPIALMKLAKAHFEAGNYEMAGRKYDEFKQKYPKHQFAAVAILGKLHCIEALGRTEEALAGYSSFLAENPKSFVAAEAMFGKGRCLEALNRAKEAKTLFEDYLAQDRQGAWSMRAEEQLAILKRKLGEKSQEKPSPTSASSTP